MFVFATSQVHAEQAVKFEVARDRPEFRFAYSRPGFLTFRVPDGTHVTDDFDLGSIFARASGLSLGKVTGTIDERVRKVWELAGDRTVQALHVFPRDTRPPAGTDKYEPGLTPAAREIEAAIRRLGPEGLPAGSDYREPEPGTPFGQKILDVVLIDENEWWVGYHESHSIPSSWPGGFMPGELPPQAVSRVYLKMLEGLTWSELPMKPGQTCVEIGSAPGGASQVLLERGLSVIGIDPADMHPDVLADPHFQHLQKRSKEVKRRTFVGVDWLTSDINLPPKYTLDTVEAIVTYEGVKLRGLLLTLKMPQWSLVEQIPDFLARIRSWGFRNVQARQLHHNRQEICVAASRR